MITVVANLKGGVGKTTVVTNVGSWLAKTGVETLLVDLDPQASLSRHFGYMKRDIEPGTQSLFDTPPASLQSCIRQTEFENLQIVPTASRLAMVERRAGIIKGQGLQLANSLQEFSANRDVFVDCGPQAGLLMINALAAADRIIIPVQTEYLALEGLRNMLRTLAMLEQSRGKQCEYLVVPTMYDRRTRASRIALADLQRDHAEHLWSSVIPVDTLFRDASRAKQPLAWMRPKSAGSEACQQLALELFSVPEGDQRLPAVG